MTVCRQAFPAEKERAHVSLFGRGMREIRYSSMEKMSGKQIRSMAFLMAMGGRFVIGGTKEAGAESYLAAALSIILIIPAYALYEYLLHKAGADGIFALCKQCLGKVAGKIAIALFGLYALWVGMALVGNLLNFIYTVFLTNTAPIVVGCACAVTVAIAMKCGRMAMARVSRLLMFSIFGILFVTALLSLISINFNSFPAPFLYESFLPVAKGALSVFTMPFGDIILLLPLLSGGRAGGKGSRELLKGAGITWVFLVAIFLRNVLALGPETYEMLFFKSFVAVRIISVGAFFQHIEILVSVIYILCDIFKLVVCTQCFTKCIAEIFDKQEDTVFAAPTVFLILGMASAFVINERYVVQFIQVNKYLSLVFIVLLPAIIAIAYRIWESSNNRRRRTGSISSSVPARGRGSARP